MTRFLLRKPPRANGNQHRNQHCRQGQDDPKLLRTRLWKVWSTASVAPVLLRVRPDSVPFQPLQVVLHLATFDSAGRASFSIALPMMLSVPLAAPIGRRRRSRFLIHYRMQRRDDIRARERLLAVAIFRSAYGLRNIGAQQEAVHGTNVVTTRMR